jgi:predicted sugar kinase
VTTSNKAIELISPACLPLGIVLAGGKPAVLGITLQYPPIQMIARPNNELSTTGARSPIARAQASAWFERHTLPPKAELEIELAIPAYMGLGSEAMMDLTVASALKHLTGLEGRSGLDNRWGLESAAHRSGGLLVVGRESDVIHRHELKHHDNESWVVIIHMPQAAQGTSSTFETDLREALFTAQPTTDIEPFWNAVITNDLEAAGKALMQIQAETRTALEAADKPQAISTEANEVLELIRTSRNIHAWGQSFGGLAMWGLIQGAGASTEARTRLRRAMSYEGGTTMASITSNTGVQTKPAEQ